jgi:cell division septation protein DedD
MTAAKAKKSKRAKKPFRIEMTRLALVGWCFGLLLALAWMFVLGLFVGKGITPSNINFAKIRKRMVTEGVWPGSGENARPEKPAQESKTKKKIPLKDLEFYRELDKKKKATLEKPVPESTPPKKSAAPGVSAGAASSSRPRGAAVKRQKPSSVRFTVQVASFKELASAKKFASRLKGLNSQASIRHVDLPGRGRWYRVQVGELSSRDEAIALAERLTKQYHLQAFVMRLE